MVKGQTMAASAGQFIALQRVRGQRRREISTLHLLNIFSKTLMARYFAYLALCYVLCWVFFQGRKLKCHLKFDYLEFFCTTLADRTSVHTFSTRTLMKLLTDPV